MATGAKSGAKGVTGERKFPKSRWPKESADWSGKQRAEYSKKIATAHPKEDPEYGMPDGSE